MTRLAAFAIPVIWMAWSPEVSAVRQAADAGHIRSLLDRASYAEAEREATSLVRSLESDEKGGSAEAAHALDLLVEARGGHGKAVEPRTRELAERGVRLSEQGPGASADARAIALHNLATVLVELGDREAALTLHQRALAIRETETPRVEA